MATFQEKTGAQNPLDAVRTDSRGSAKPSFADIDKDGDLDAFVGTGTALSNTGRIMGGFSLSKRVLLTPSMV
ncbi:MAG TPA: hypothetical protein DCQ63_09630 [Planktothrix sp. UBA8402]|jgi:hypothetical protein|nr:hypothetical protein [Planktothrix sp. UBA8402]